MKRLVNLLLALFILGAADVRNLAQGGGGEETKKTPPKVAPSPPKPPGGKKVPPAGPPKVIIVREPPKPSPKALAADLTIKSFPTDCEVLVDGKPRGVTKDGLLNLTGLKSGPHIVKVQRSAYRGEERNVYLNAGQNNIVPFTLSGLPGTLSIRPNIAGASIEFSGTSNGSFTNQVVGQSLPAGQYQLRVSKSGYKTEVRPFVINPAATVNLNITLNPVTPAEMLSQAELDFRQKRYPDVIDSCLGVLKSQPDNALANHLLGASYYLTERFPESIPPLTKAIKAGREVALPIKHHHRGPNMGMDDALCSGRLTFRKDSLAFNSADLSGHDFLVPYNKIYEIKQEAHKAGRINLKIGIPKGNKEERKDYNFHVSQAQVVNTSQTSTYYQATCNNCQRAVEMLYQLLQQLRQ